MKIIALFGVTAAVTTLGAIESAGTEAVPSTLPRFAETAERESNPQPGESMLRAHLPSPWNDRVVGGFRKGAMEANVSVGIGPGSAILGSTATHDIALAKLSLGRVVSNTRAEGRWYRGNWELLGEMFGGGQFEPNAAYLVGLTGVLRYNFVTSTRLVPFFDLGAGVSATDIGRPDLGSTFEFNTQIGGGLRWFFNAHAAITAQYRLLHLSNAGTAHPNGGVNTSMFYVGVSWIF